MVPKSLRTTARSARTYSAIRKTSYENIFKENFESVYEPQY